MPTPFIEEEFTFFQPDGSTLQVRGWGNQDRAIFETLDGFTVVQDPATGFYQYATTGDDGSDLMPTGFQAEMIDPAELGLSPNLRPNQAGGDNSGMMTSELASSNTRWQTRREITRMQLRAAAMAPPGLAPAPPQRETVGDFVGLCVLIDFPNEPATISADEVDRFCNQPGYSGFGNSGSVYDYFLEVSGGKLRYNNIIAPYYTALHNKGYYTDEKHTYPTRAQELIHEALNHLLAEGFDFNSLTSDSGGFVYAINVFYAGNRDNNWAQGLWPHASSLVLQRQLMPGRIAADYQFTDMGSELTLGTFCHENGHMLCDFPDLYDYGKDKFESSGIGGFCLMCMGGKLDKKNPTNVNVYLKFRAGWADDVSLLQPGAHVKIQADSNDYFIHRKSTTEYFIVENRQKTRRDKALRGSGLAIWHVDELGSNERQNMTPSLHYECSLEQADGDFDLENGLTPYGDAGDLYPAQGNNTFGNDTIPNSRWWDDSSSGLELTNINVDGGVLSFDVSP